jgi:amidase
LPWREVEIPKKLKLGYFVNDGIAKASPACQRAVKETVDAMKQEGHEVVEVNVKKLEVLQALELFVALTSADGYATLLSGLKGDPREDSLFLVTLGPRLPWPVRSLACFLLKHLLEDEVMATVIHASRKKTVQELMTWQAKREEFAERVRRYLWDEMKLDAVVCPSQSMPAMPIGSTWGRSMIAIATFFWNVCDSTVGQLPVTHVDSTLDTPTPSWNEQAFLSPSVHKALYGPETGVYDPQKMAGLPVGVQIVGAQWEEEKVLGVMRVVEATLERAGKRRFGPGRFSERGVEPVLHS